MCSHKQCNETDWRRWRGFLGALWFWRKSTSTSFKTVRANNYWWNKLHTVYKDVHYFNFEINDFTSFSLFFLVIMNTIYLLVQYLKQLQRNLPSFTIPTDKHFWNLQNWHRFRLRLSTGQFLSAKQTYFAFFWTVLWRKKTNQNIKWTIKQFVY